jgi:N-acyl-D-aspartate/D-glutamate deacylase
MLDILIQNGLVVDGSGAPRYRADVAMESEDRPLPWDKWST